MSIRTEFQFYFGYIDNSIIVYVSGIHACLVIFSLHANILYENNF